MRSRPSILWLALFLLSAALSSACTSCFEDVGADGGVDAGEDDVDAGELDAGADEVDAGEDDVDAGEGEVDAGEDEIDAGEGEVDAGEGEVDAGEDEVDAGEDEVDAGADEIDAGEDEVDAGAEEDAGTDAGPPLQVCLSAGNALSAGAAAATCADPIVVDLTGAEDLEVNTLTVAGTTGANELGWPVTPTNACFETGQDPARDVVFSVELPAGWTRFVASVNAATGSDPILSVQTAESCAVLTGACADDRGEDECEIVEAINSLDFADTLYLVVSELSDSGQPWDVHFKIDIP